jgi:hypothetical protein
VTAGATFTRTTTIYPSNLELLRRIYAIESTLDAITKRLDHLAEDNTITTQQMAELMGCSFDQQVVDPSGAGGPLDPDQHIDDIETRDADGAIKPSIHSRHHPDHNPY